MRLLLSCAATLLSQFALWHGVACSESHAKTIGVARAAAPPGLGNPFTSAAQPTSGVWSLIFDALTMFDESWTLQPGLAVSWNATSDTTWEFRLRPDVVFHNGQSLDATVVAEAIGLLLTEEARGYYIYPSIDTLASVRAVGDLAIEITTNRPDPILPQRLSLVMIVEPLAWRDQSADGFAMSPVGTGPYTLQEWGVGNRKIVLEAFSASWRSPIDVHRIEMTIMPDPVSRTQALLSGAVDVVEQAGRALKPVNQSRFKAHIHPTDQVLMLVYLQVGNAGSPILHRDVREALSYTVNRQAITDIIYDGEIESANQPVTPAITGYNGQLKNFPYDLERARQLIANAGFSDGLALEAEYVNSATDDALQMLQVIAQDMKCIGVQLTLTPTTIQNFFSKWQSGQWGGTDLFLAFSDGSIFYDAARPIHLLSCDKPSPFVCNERIAKQLREIEMEMDTEARTKGMENLIADLVADYPAIWISEMTSRTITSERVVELPMRPHGIAFEKVSWRRTEVNDDAIKKSNTSHCRFSAMIVVCAGGSEGLLPAPHPGIDKTDYGPPIPVLVRFST